MIETNTIWKATLIVNFIFSIFLATAVLNTNVFIFGFELQYWLKPKYIYFELPGTINQHQRGWKMHSSALSFLVFLKQLCVYPYENTMQQQHSLSQEGDSCHASGITKSAVHFSNTESNHEPTFSPKNLPFWRKFPRLESIKYLYLCLQVVFLFIVTSLLMALIVSLVFLTKTGGLTESNIQNTDQWV